MIKKILNVLVLTWLMLIVGMVFASFVQAEGPEYIKGDGLVHQTSCTPPTTREPNAEGIQVPITEEELEKSTVYLYQGGDLFTEGLLIDGPIDTDIYCNHTWNIDDYPAGQKYARATTTDTLGQTSEVSVKGGPFLSILPLAPPSPPVMME